MDILKLLNELERLIEDQTTVMGVTLNFHPDDYLDITNKIRATLPEEVKRASRVTAESDKIVDGARETAEATLEDATTEADQIIREARANAERVLREAEAQVNKVTLSTEASSKQTVEEARQRAEKMLADSHKQSETMVGGSEVVRLATAQAREIVAAAEHETQSLRHGADEYAHGVMTDLERQVAELMSTIQRGRMKLDQRVAVPQPAQGGNGNGTARVQEVAGARR